MSRICILGDTHIGCRNDHIAFHDYAEKFYKNVFFPYLKDHKIKMVIQTGDLFDRRKFINFNTLHRSKEYFFSEFSKVFEPIRLWTYIGNHDSYYRNSLKVNSSKLLVGSGPAPIEVVEYPRSITIGNLEVDIIPWICEDNRKQIEEFIQKSESRVCFGHFEIKGFEMDRGNICHDGIDREYLNKYEMVISGHFHHPSTDGHIFYVGAPMQFTWSDYGDRRGFHIFDTESLDLEFIENPYKMFHKITYNDEVETLESVSEKDFGEITTTMVKVVVVKKDNPVLFDHFMDGVYKAQPLDVTIVEDFTDYNLVTEGEIVDQAATTTDILDNYVDSIEIGLDKNKMKSILREVYTLALDSNNDII
jgi:DNA repair exonuclease SbcCD nuclease subunit